MNLVPKRIFFFWGNDRMSWLRYMSLYSFRKYNPDWPITLYISKSSVNNKVWSTPEGQDFFNYEGENWLPKVEELGVSLEEWDFPNKDEISPSHQGDFLKWQKLSEHGGIFSDMDILYLQSIDPLYDGLKYCNVGITYREYFSIGFLSGIPDNKFYKDLLEASQLYYTKDRYQSAGVNTLTTHLETFRGNGMRHLRDRYTTLSFYNIDMDYLYPWPYNEMSKVFENRKATPLQTVGLHWYAGSSLAQKYNKLLTPSTYRNYRCTISNYLEEVLND